MLKITTETEYLRAVERAAELVNQPNFDEDDQEILEELEEAIEAYQETQLESHP